MRILTTARQHFAPLIPLLAPLTIIAALAAGPVLAQTKPVVPPSQQPLQQNRAQLQLRNQMNNSQQQQKNRLQTQQQNQTERQRSTLQSQLEQQRQQSQQSQPLKYKP